MVIRAFEGKNFRIKEEVILHKSVKMCRLVEFKVAASGVFGKIGIILCCEYSPKGYLVKDINITGSSRGRQAETQRHRLASVLCEEQREKAEVFLKKHVDQWARRAEHKSRRAALIKSHEWLNDHGQILVNNRPMRVSFVTGENEWQDWNGSGHFLLLPYHGSDRNILIPYTIYYTDDLLIDSGNIRSHLVNIVSGIRISSDIQSISRKKIDYFFVMDAADFCSYIIFCIELLSFKVRADIVAKRIKDDADRIGEEISKLQKLYYSGRVVPKIIGSSSKIFSTSTRLKFPTYLFDIEVRKQSIFWIGCIVEGDKIWYIEAKPAPEDPKKLRKALFTGRAIYADQTGVFEVSAKTHIIEFARTHASRSLFIPQSLLPQAIETDRKTVDILKVSKIRSTKYPRSDSKLKQAHTNLINKLRRLESKRRLFSTMLTRSWEYPKEICSAAAYLMDQLKTPGKLPNKSTAETMKLYLQSKSTNGAMKNYLERNPT